MRKLTRHDYMSSDNKAKWLAAEEQAGKKIPRTAENCIRIFKVARPGKTAQDRAR